MWVTEDFKWRPPSSHARLLCFYNKQSILWGTWLAGNGPNFQLAAKAILMLAFFMADITVFMFYSFIFCVGSHDNLDLQSKTFCIIKFMCDWLTVLSWRAMNVKQLSYPQLLVKIIICIQYKTQRHLCFNCIFIQRLS